MKKKIAVFTIVLLVPLLGFSQVSDYTYPSKIDFNAQDFFDKEMNICPKYFNNDGTKRILQICQHTIIFRKNNIGVNQSGHLDLYSIIGVKEFEKK